MKKLIEMKLKNLKSLSEAAKTIDDEYNSSWSNIPRDIFDKIIFADPDTKLDRNLIGNNAKRFLLPKYASGETNFIDDIDTVNKALTTYTANRGSYPPELRNIANFPSVDAFVKYVENPEENDLSVTDDHVNKVSKLEEIRQKYYSDILEDEFLHLISLDPQTNVEKGVIGDIAKNLILRLFKADKYDIEPGSIDEKKLISIIQDFIDKRNEFVKKGKANLNEYDDIKDFITMVENDAFAKEPEEYLRYIQSFPDWQKDIRYLGSTAKYDIFESLTHYGNAIIAGADTAVGGPGFKSDGYSRDYLYNVYGHWCTSGMPFRWPYYKTNNEKYYNFMLRNNTASNKRRDNFQAAICPDGDVTLICTGEEGPSNWNNLLASDPDILPILALEDDCAANLPDILGYKLVKDSALYEPFHYSGIKSIEGLKSKYGKNYAVFTRLCRQLVIEEGVTTIPAAQFMNWSNLNKISFPSTLKVIGPQAFKNCYNIGLLKLNNGLEKIGSEAFARCTSLHGTVRLPNSVTIVGVNVFQSAHITISIPKNRPENSLQVPKSEYQWWANNYKIANVIEEGLELDEDIPKDLANLYKFGFNPKREKGIQNTFLQQSGHAYDMQGRYPQIDYYHSKYEVLSFEEAVRYLGLDGNIGVPEVARRAANLRIIVNGQLVEFECSRFGEIYYTYSTVIPWDQLINAWYQLNLPGDAGFKIDNNHPLSNDTKYVRKKHELKAVLYCASKIYKTDEYNHIIRDKDQRLQLAKDKEKAGTRKVTRLPSPGADGYHLHDYNPKTDTDRDIANRYDWAKNPEYYSINTPEYTDTGNHNRLSGVGHYNSSISSLLDHKAALYKNFTAARKALDNLERNKADYDEDEYELLHNTYENEKDIAYRQYRDAADSFIKFSKSHVSDPYIPAPRTSSGWKDLEARMPEIANIKNITDWVNARLAMQKKIKDQTEELRRIERSIESYNNVDVTQLQGYKNVMSEAKTTLDKVDKINKSIEEDFDSISEYERDIKNSLEEIEKLKRRIKSQEDNIKVRRDDIGRKEQSKEQYYKEIQETRERADIVAEELVQKQIEAKRILEDQLEEIRNWFESNGLKIWSKPKNKEISTELKNIFKDYNDSEEKHTLSQGDDSAWVYDEEDA